LYTHIDDLLKKYYNPYKKPNQGVPAIFENCREEGSIPLTVIASVFLLTSARKRHRLAILHPRHPND
jgi:hypothetical protein